MTAFDTAAFDAAAFDTGAEGGGVGSVTPTPASAQYSARLPLRVLVSAPTQISLPLEISVSAGQVFDSTIGAVAWSLRVIIGGQDVSARMTGELRIDAEEDSARIASMSLIPQSAAQLAALESAAVTVDVTVSGGGYSASRRRFTGVVESVTFSAATRIATLSCRDEYQDRIRAAGEESSVRAFFGGMETVSPKILAWNNEDPDPAGYFSGVLETVPGATYVDGAGSWRVVRWDIGSPSRTYTAADMFDPGPTVETAQRAEMPSAVVATLSHRFPRLHNTEINLTWESVGIPKLSALGLTHPSKAMIRSALDGLGDWIVKGDANISSPVPGFYPINNNTGFYVIWHRQARVSAAALDVTVYRRWYQDIDRRYQVRVEIGGLSGRDEVISRSMRSDFDGGVWESGRRSAPPLGIYSANAPAAPVDAPVLTGYEALDGPWPPGNGALDHFADLSSSDVQQACRHVIAEATKKAAEWRRGQRVLFDRPADLRLEIGSVVALSAYGVAATGQVAGWSELYDIDSGGCVGSYTIAAPAGNGSTTGYAATVTIPPPAVVHSFVAPALENHAGGTGDTPTQWVHPDTVSGYLFTASPTSDLYSDSRPRYEEQFRIVLPEIPAIVRDPAIEEVSVDAEISLAGSGVTITF